MKDSFVIFSLWYKLYGFFVLLDYVREAICRAAIDDDMFDIAIGLRSYGGKGLPQAGGVVVVYGYDA